MPRQAAIQAAVKTQSSIAQGRAKPVSKYTPKAGSIPYQVCRFLFANPDEELTRADIAVKFGVPGSAVDTALDYAVTMGMLNKGKNTDLDQVWMAGPHIEHVVIEPWPDDPDVKSRAEAANDALAIRLAGGEPALALPAIRRNTPLLTSDAAKKKAERMRAEIAWDTWLGQFRPNDSAEFSAESVKEFRQHARRYSREHKTKFRILAVRPGVFGIERKA